MKHAAALLLIGGFVCAQDTKLLPLKARIDLSGVEGRIDHFSPDLKGQRLFMAALGNQTVEVLDVAAAKRVSTIRDLAEPQGIYFDASTNRLFVACRKDGAVKVFDGGTLKLLATAKFSGDADNVRYDARGKRIIAGFGDGALGFIDTEGKKLGEIRLDAHPESFQLEKSGTRAFVNVPDHKQIEVADLSKMAIIAKWPVTSALKNYPMTLDEANHRLLIGCRNPARMLVIDTQTGRQTTSVEIAGDTDDMFYDAEKRSVYVIGGEGFVDIFDQKGADKYDRVGRVATAPGARTGFFVPEWSKLFVAVPHRGAQRTEVLVFETR